MKTNTINTLATVATVTTYLGIIVSNAGTTTERYGTGNAAVIWSIGGIVTSAILKGIWKNDKK